MPFESNRRGETALVPTVMSREERLIFTLTFRYHKLTRVLLFIGVCFVLPLVLALIVYLLLQLVPLDHPIFVALYWSASIIVAMLALFFAETWYQTRQRRMREWNRRFRFGDMADSSVTTLILEKYFALRPTHSISFSQWGKINEWVRRMWEYDTLYVDPIIIGYSVQAYRWRWKALTESVQWFIELGVPLPEGFKVYCALLVESGRKAYETACRDELASLERQKRSVDIEIDNLKATIAEVEAAKVTTN